MARQVAIVVGVRKAGNLVPLPGAISGANDFAKWAQSAGFEVTKITDEHKAVTSRLLKEAIKSSLEVPDVDRLFIYFAGHGVSLGLDVDFWLLSNIQDDVDEAVNLANSLRFAKRSGIKHVAIFADACRTSAGKSQLGIHGCTLFPPKQRTKPAQLDQFYAAQSGNSAQEVRFEDDELQKSFGVFTDCLMTAIQGRKLEAAELVPLNGHRGLAVTAKSLADYIQLAVAERLLNIPGAAPQVPDPRPGSYPPNVLARIEQDPSMMTLTVEVDGPPGPSPKVTVLGFDSRSNDFKVAAAGPPPLEVEMQTGSLYKIEVELRGYQQDGGTADHIFQLSADETQTPKLELELKGRGEPKPPSAPSSLLNVVVSEDGSEHASAPSTDVYRVTSHDLLTGRAASEYRYLKKGEEPWQVAALSRDKAAEQSVDRLSIGVGRDHFETATGLTVIGVRVVEAWVGGGHAGLFEEGGAWHVRGFPRDHQDGRGVPRATSALLQLVDGRFAAVAMMSDFLGTITVGQGGVEQVSYVPAPGSRFDLPDFEAERAHRALARATVAVNYGRFRIAEELAGEFAEALRMYKHFNPTLGIYAAYAYDMAGSTDMVRDLIRYYEEYEQPVPYDIAFLSGLPFDQIGVHVSPSFPMLTQGWAYLSPDDLHPVVEQARGSLGRSLWTMPTGDDGHALALALKNNDLKGELL